MKKTKTETTGFMHRALFVLSGVVLLVTSFVAMFPAGQVLAFPPLTSNSSMTAKGKTDPLCKKYSGGTLTACGGIYAEGYDGINSLNCAADGNNGALPVKACNAVYAAGEAARKADDALGTTADDQKAITYCTSPSWNYNNSDLDAYNNSSNGKNADGTLTQVQACETGYISALEAKQADQNVPCGAKDIAGNYKDACTAGFQQGLKEYEQVEHVVVVPVATVESKAKTYCELPSSGFSNPNASQDLFYKTTELQACEQGYEKSLLGSSVDAGSACSSFKDTGDANAEYNRACKTGFLQGIREYQKAAGVATPASPNNNNNANNTANGANANSQLSCNFSASPLSWIICPVVDLLVGIVNDVDNLITNQLSIETDTIFCTNTDTCQAYYTAWASFRDIALGLLIIAGLVMVTSQALGMEIFDAYTIRKLLPRILIAAIAITLSWTLMKFAIDLSNDLGFGVRHLIYAPFANLKDGINLNFGGAVSSLFTGLGATGVGLVAGVPIWVEFGGIGALLSFAGTAALAVVIAEFVLILRQVAMILLALVSAIALVCWILPRTKRVYDLWWEAFSRGLLMFPMIAALIASGRVFSAVSIHNGGAVNGLVGFVAYFAPYFLIPLTFKFAGGAVRQLGGFVNDRSRGAFDGLRNVRKKQQQERHKAARTGGLYRNAFGKFTNPITGKEHNVSGLLNTVTNQTIDAQDGWRIAAASRGGPIGRALFGRQGRSLMARIGNQQIDHSTEAAKELQLRYHAGRVVAGKLDYVGRSLQKYDRKHGITGNETPEEARAKGSKYQELVDQFAHHDKKGNVMRRADGSIKWRGPENEKEYIQAANLIDYGLDAGSHEAAKELRAKAIELDSFKGAGKEETQRADVKFAGMMAAAQQGRLENKDLVDYYNDMAEEGEPEEAMKRLERLQELAAPLRTSQKRGYGIGFETVKGADGRNYERAVDTYANPASEAAQASVGRADASDIVGKAEDLRDPDGDLSGWSQSLIAAASDYEMDTVTDPQTGKPVVERRKEYLKNEDGTPIMGPDGTQMYKHVPKSKDKLLEAQKFRSMLQSIEGYSQGDTGFGGQLYKIMQASGTKMNKYGDQAVSEDPAIRERLGLDAHEGPVVHEGIHTPEEQAKYAPPKAPPPQAPDSPLAPRQGIPPR